MELKNLEFELNEEHRVYREKLISVLKTHEAIAAFMKEYACPWEVVEKNAFRFKSWLEELDRVKKLTPAMLDSDPKRGYYQNLYFDKHTGVLMDEYIQSPTLLQEIKNMEHLNAYEIFDLSKSYHRAFFETLNLNNENARYLKLVRDLSEFVGNEALGYFIYGDLGVGKSYLAACVSNAMAKLGHSVAFVTTSDLLSHLKLGFSNPFETDRTLEVLKRVNLLVLDDLGSEPVTTWSRDEVLLPLLNDRLENNRKTLITSNYRPEMLDEAYALDSKGNVDELRAKRFVDRVLSLTSPYEIVGENRRRALKR